MIKRLADHVVVRFIIAGGTSACVNLSVFYVLNSVLNLYYVLASVIAFIVAFFVSFTLHKFWTFRSHDESHHKQMALYLFTSLLGLAINTVLIVFFVDFLHVYEFVSQVLAGIGVAFCSFWLNHKVVFKYKNDSVLEIDIK